jgi:hypothetical protein
MIGGRLVGTVGLDWQSSGVVVAPASGRADDEAHWPALAHNIIALAKGGDRNPERLCEGALKALNRSAAS